ncbi:hypothetical protein [Acetobacter sp.]|uniref:hypothetical protein n=1 Tax=Acetobacter sp. TaxID=440 RepID=UPI0025C1BFB2|nr:hypothetical protein [Acetobacter sp.]MCH4090568.1 hypothetical protein [Acetobacter sp.]MCI1299262.1 hypothetical protein [Acetobacter sp.]MCI1315809.1 hypothetical protein [Acetobacter sp.]
MATWDSLADVYNHLIFSEDFEVVVASIRHRFPGEAGFSHETETHEELSRKGVDHIRFSGDNCDENIKLLKCIAPDGVFRQSPWDCDIPPEFSVENMVFTNLFYVPYFGFNIVESFTKNPDERDYQADQDFHRACSLVFCESEITRNLMAQKSRRGGDHFVATGHPKLERLLGYKQNPEWPIAERNIYSKKLRIIWAPHHSVDGGWLSFGVFPEIYKGMLEWVKNDQNVEMVLKPHPALFSKLVAGSQLTLKEVNDFREEWEGQPNATIVEHGEYGPLLAASDIMLTDGISFLAEYMLFFEKPLVFMENPQHSPFNEVGRIIEKACYVTHGVEETRKCVAEVMRGDGDYKFNQRKATKDVLLPFEFGAAERIVTNLRKFFA